MTSIKVDVPLPKEINQLVDKQLKKDLQKTKNLLYKREEQLKDWKSKCHDLELQNRNLTNKLNFYSRLKDYFKDMLEDGDL